MKYSEPRYFSKRIFTKILFIAIYSILKYQKELKLINKKFKTNIMLSVTYVNGCAICSHHHAKELIKEGANEEELKIMLEGSYKELNNYETHALLFAEHYANTFGKFDSDAFIKIKDLYGNETAYGILATIKIIMFGNVYGISFGNIINRLKFRRVTNAKLLTDIYNTISVVILIPVFVIVNLFRKKAYI